MNVYGILDGPAVSWVELRRVTRVPFIETAAVRERVDVMSAAARVVHESTVYEEVLGSTVVVVGFPGRITVGDQSLADNGASVAPRMVVLHHAAGNES